MICTQIRHKGKAACMMNCLTLLPCPNVASVYFFYTVRGSVKMKYIIHIF